MSGFVDEEAEDAAAAQESDYMTLLDQEKRDPAFDELFLHSRILYQSVLPSLTPQVECYEYLDHNVWQGGVIRMQAPQPAGASLTHGRLPLVTNPSGAPALPSPQPAIPAGSRLRGADACCGCVGAAA